MWSVLCAGLLMAIWMHSRVGAGPDALPSPDVARGERATAIRSPRSSTQPTVRCAVIGGMTFTGFWTALADRYENQTGVHLELITTGPKYDLVKVFKQGNVDVITMHSSDAIVNLVANGYALDPQPWMRNDLVIGSFVEHFRAERNSARSRQHDGAVRRSAAERSESGGGEARLHSRRSNPIPHRPIAQQWIGVDGAGRPAVDAAVSGGGD
jgi:hypothetical protein